MMHNLNMEGTNIRRKMSSEKQKTYKVSIQWETEIKAKDYNEAILKGSDEWFFDYDQDHFEAEEVEYVK